MGRRIARVGKDCVACGNCAKHCRVGAVKVDRGLRAEVDESACRGCGKCEQACPAAVVMLESREVACA